MTRCEVIGDATLYLGDALEVLPTLPMVDAWIVDPPYFGVKGDAWDNQWKTPADFLAWASQVARRLDSGLARNGSLYWFASPQMAGRIEVALREVFEVRNCLVWDKSAGRKGVGGTGVDVSSLRCFWTANSERIIFAETKTGDDEAATAAGYETACEGARVSVFGDYLRSEFKLAGASNREIAALFPSCTGGLTGCVSNWLLGLNQPTAEQYATMRGYLNSTRGAEYLRREYEELRRPFFLEPADQWGDVWRFDPERTQVHPTQKPLALMRYIVKASTRPCALVADCFMGSGTTGVAALQLGRCFVGIEREPRYFDIACRRIEAAHAQRPLFDPAPAAQPVQMGLA